MPIVQQYLENNPAAILTGTDVVTVEEIQTSEPVWERMPTFLALGMPLPYEWEPMSCDQTAKDLEENLGCM